MARTTTSLAAHLIVLVGCATAPFCWAEGRARDGRRLKKPVFRIAKRIDQKAIQQKQPQGHPIDPALRLAHEGLARMQRGIRDYTATLVKRETVNGKLLDPEFMDIKVRNRRVQNGRTVVPFSIYMKYLKPQSKKGQEAIWVEGRYNNKIVGHGTGLQGFLTVYLDPDGFLATRGTNYAIYDLGLENLIYKLIERGEQARQHGECEVQFFKNAKINGRLCTLIQVTHPVRRPYFDFHIAQIFIDDELQVPVRYAAYAWPQTPGGKPGLIEEFTYLNININVGLTDADFDHKNPNYSYP